MKDNSHNKCKFDLNVKDGESELSYIWRLGQAKESGLISLQWSDIADLINENFREDESEYRTEASYRKPFQQAKRYYESGVFNSFDEDKYIEELHKAKYDIEIERKKLQTEKLEYNRWLREEARDHLIAEKICDAVSSLPPLKVPEKIELSPCSRGWVLAFGDEHYGTEFEIKDIYGDVINSYSPEEFESRMWALLQNVREIVDKENIQLLHVYNLGDFSDGCLRASQLMKLRYGVVEGTVRYARFISYWLNDLSSFVNVKFQMTDGNHTELRMLGQPKGTFTDDNMGKVVREFIKISLKDNPNFTMYENPTGFIYDVICGSTILGIHGEVKKPETAINELSMIYGVNFDYLIMGHKHHNKVEEVGIGKEIIGIGSIIGTDDYSMKLRKTSNASAKVIGFNSAYGKFIEYTIGLN